MSRLVAFLCFLISLSAAAQQDPISGLPQGLTCGLSYADQKCLWPIACGPTIPIDNVCSSHGATSHTIEIICPGGDCKHNIPTPAQGYITIYDGDFGVGSGDIGFGYWHQELADGITDTTLSQRFVLPQGAACGFHHTYTSPGRTCMGLDPTYQCPDGWTQRRAHDADGSLIGAVTGTGQYWVWCEYDDPNHYSARTISSFPGHFIVGLPPLGTSPTTGIACGISHNAGGEDHGPVCMGYRPFESGCPGGTTIKGWIDQERPDGYGLAVCTTYDSVFFFPALARGFLETTSTSTGTFSGWTYDPNAPETSNFVDFYIDGPIHSGAPRFRVPANAPRPDVNAYFNLKTGDHGYSFTLPAQFLGSSHTVYAYGVSLYGQDNPPLLQSPGTYTPPPPPPPDPPPPPTCKNCFIQ